MTDEDLLQYFRLGEKLYFERRLREFMDVMNHCEGPKEIYERMIIDPYRFYQNNLDHFRMPINMMVNCFKEFKNVA